jgi:hypothetical protein
MLLDILATHTEHLPPDDEKVGNVFARLGYQFADAVADLVDNSIDAGARHIHVRFVRHTKGIHSVLIADDGIGMSDAELHEAMRFGSRSKKTGKELGKYGIGLKSASLSQADVVTVLTRKARAKAINGRRWRLELVKKGWKCEVLDPAGSAKVLRDDVGAVNFKLSGTLVIWEKLEHLHALPTNIDQVLERTIRTLHTELGIRFHRFLESESVAITTDQQELGEDPSEIHVPIRALNPFSYDQSGDEKYPLKLPLIVAGIKLPVVCHVWPAKSNALGYRLGGGKVALRQGFYFYRNDRLIQAGGWNGLRGDDGEPHLSLARVQVDVPDSLDSIFKLQVTKMGLQPTPEFIQALQAAKGPGGLTFEKYISDAQSVYRKRKTIERARFPMVPADGLSPNAIKGIAKVLKEKGCPSPEPVSFRWSRLDPYELFRITPGKLQVQLNTLYRKQLAHNGKNDAPVLKLALLLLLQDELQKASVRQSAEEWIRRVNEAMIAALKD